ncbi:16S rRNA (cytosine(1402)-N(4))-methyltransferase [Longibacter salinarum]|uniref:Ribosomal RNA small subunit methyltransferase H n=1 Tax=Longibacter salinarum TaxID=1850348 RepID=A0A2A8CXB3_9BACT|nr:16S rRNA (cytosine(1402)-N(4))-methyltransferase RsmH [Longibacter salinarum]PEN13263.1 16S rRNA (cytosine(1402)-N(4))-methyltransferase [Longibacter salinarum]
MTASDAPAPSSDSESDADPLKYATEYHAPVLSHEVIDRLITDPSGCYVDATLGGGGHSEALLDALAPEGVVIGIDQDDEALATARDRLADEIEAGRFRTVQGNFGRLQTLLEEIGIEEIDGLLLDLGVSSHQIDVPERGFSFQREGPLDMRMDPRGGLTAHQIVNHWAQRDIADVIYHYGDERRSRPIARAIVDARPLETTHDLADAVRSAVPERDEVKSLARVFQGLRIAVNAELDVLEDVLEQSADVIREGGRIAVISYHSLEDRRVKRFLRYGNFEGKPIRDIYGTLIAPFEESPRSAIEAGEAEVQSNPRARSARLRIAERTADDAGTPVPSV